MSTTTSTDPATPAAAAQTMAERLGLGTSHTAVAGLQFGDEGKGQIVDVLAQEYDLVVRYNGGANAGHTVLVGDQKFALHLLPSGILCPNAVCVVGNGVVIDPAQILKEIDGLRERGVEIGDNLKISDRAHVVMPYHKIQDSLYDQAVAAAYDGSAAIGTTGRGIGPCYADKALRSTAIRIGDLLHPEKLKTTLSRIVAVKNAMLKSLADACSKEFESLQADQLLADVLGYAERLKPHIANTSKLLDESIEAGKRVLFEGANATMLDIDHGTYPFVTSSSCSALGIHPGAGIPGRTVQQVVGVAKLYTSRVGGGPFPTELHDETAEEIRQVGNEFGTTTGRPRRCGWLDLVAVRYAVRLSGVTALVCTGLSVIAGLDKLQLCVGYDLDGERIDTLPSDADELARVKPIYEELPGFGQATSECREFSELPDAAKAYVKRVEEFVGVRIAGVCVGRRRDQILVR